MAELRLNIVECKYPNIVQDELLKDQLIFGVCVKEVQDHLLGEITPEDNSDKCLLEADKVESKIEQCKLLGIKTSVTYDGIHSNNNNRGRSKSRKKFRDMVGPKVTLETVSIVGEAMIEAVVQHLVKNVPNVEERTISSLYVRVVQMINVTQAAPGPRKARVAKEKNSMK